MKIIELPRTKLRKIKELSSKLHNFESEFDNLFKTNNRANNFIYNWEKKSLNKNKGVVFVAIDDSRLAGYILGWMEKRPKALSKIDKRGYLCDLFADRKFRGKGLGKALVRKLFDWFKQNGIKYVQVNTPTKNKRARKFYKRIGFKEQEIMLRVKIG